MNLAAATNENLAHTSNVLIYSSMAVYTLAFFAHIAEWVFGSRSKVGRTAAALTGAEGADAMRLGEGAGRAAGRRHRRTGPSEDHHPRGGRIP